MAQDRKTHPMYSPEYGNQACTQEDPHLSTKRGSVLDAIDQLERLVEEACQLPDRLRERLVRVTSSRPIAAQKDNAERAHSGCDLSQTIRTLCERLHNHNESVRALLEEIDL